MARSYTTPCEECGQPKLVDSSLAPFAKCASCGKLQPKPKEQLHPEQFVPPVAPDLPEFELPDYTEVMVGWRAWQIVMRAGVPLVQSITGRLVWPARQRVEAYCRKPHAVPFRGCMCGLYSAKTREHLMDLGYNGYSDPNTRAIGTVSLWGKVIEGDQGWRAEFAYPREMYVAYEAYELAAGLQDAYGVPVRLQNVLV